MGYRHTQSAAKSKKARRSKTSPRHSRGRGSRPTEMERRHRAAKELAEIESIQRSLTEHSYFIAPHLDIIPLEDRPICISDIREGVGK